MDELVQKLTNRINELEEENARLKADLIHNDPCAVCLHGQTDPPGCDVECEGCTKKMYVRKLH